jgi:hypothetical protein
MGNSIGRRSFLKSDVKDLVLSIIITLGGKDGISKKDLLLNTSGLDQSTIYRVTKVLEHEDKIKIIRKGQRTKYAANKATIEVNAALGGHILISQASSKLFVPPSSHHTVLKKFNKKDYVEATLDEFSNIMGALITFVFIQGMNPENKLLVASDEAEQKRLAKEWLNSALSSYLMSRMFWHFKLLLYRTLSSHQHIPKGFESTIDFTAKKPLVDKAIAKKLISAFERLYPTISKSLDDIMNKLSKNIQLEKEFEKAILKGKIN